MNSLNQRKIRIAILGNTGVGKTSFVNRLSGQNRDEKYYFPSDTTCIVNIKYMKSEVDLVDVNGLGFNTMTPSEFSEMCGVIIITDRYTSTSIRFVNHWKTLIKTNIPIIVCCNERNSLISKCLLKNVINIHTKTGKNCLFTLSHFTEPFILHLNDINIILDKFLISDLSNIILEYV